MAASAQLRAVVKRKCRPLCRGGGSYETRANDRYGCSPSKDTLIQTSAFVQICAYGVFSGQMRTVTEYFTHVGRDDEQQEVRHVNQRG